MAARGRAMVLSAAAPLRNRQRRSRSTKGIPLGDHQVVFAGILQVNIGIRDMAEGDAEPETVVKAQAAAKKRRNS
jgi:hypothetical protein